MTEQKTLKLMQATIENVFGIEEYSIDLGGKFTLIEGPNETGKSSLLKAIRNTITGGSLVKIKNNDAAEDDAAKVRLVFSNGSRIVTNKTEKGISVKRQKGNTMVMEAIDQPATFLKSLMPSNMIDPVNFINAGDKERVQTILESMPIDFNEDDFWRSIGLEKDDYAKARDNLHPLNKISKYFDSITNARRDIGRDEKTARGAYIEEIDGVPAEIPTVEDVKEKEKQLIDMKTSYATGIQGLTDAAESDKSRVDYTFTEGQKHRMLELSGFSDRARADAEKRISEFAERIAVREKEALKSRDESVNTIDICLKAGLENFDKNLPKIEDLSNEIATIRADEKNANNIAQSHARANRYLHKADILKGDYERLTNSLRAVEEYKVSMVAELPIPGLDVSDGTTRVNGVEWKDVNTAQQLNIAFKIVSMRLDKSPLRLVLVDNIESLDPDSRVELFNTADEYGVQLIATGVLAGKKVTKG